MAEKEGWRVNLGDWRRAHDEIGKVLKAAEDKDSDGDVPIDRGAVYDGYVGLAGMFHGNSAAADSARGMALDRRAAASGLDVREIFATDTHDARNPTA